MIRALALAAMVIAAPAAEIAAWSFETAGGIADWRGIAGTNIAIVADGDGHALAITPVDDRHSVQTTCEVALDPAWRRVAVAARLRAEGLVLGDGSWHDVRLAIEFHAADGRLVGYGHAPCLRRDSSWLMRRSEMEIPVAAATVHLIAANFTGTGASAFDDVRISADPHRALTAGGPYRSDFTVSDADDLPIGWYLNSNQQRIVDGALELDATLGSTQAHTLIAVDPGWVRVRVACRLRAQGLVVGDTPSATARLDIDLLDGEGRPSSVHHPVISLARDADWHEQSIDVTLPVGTRWLALRPRHGGSAGVFALTDIRCSPLD